jgi:Uri superfamily endonuclease
MLFTHNLENEFPPPGPVVEIYVDDLLPRAQGQAPRDERDGERWPQQGGADMAMAVAVSPTGVVGIGAVGVGQLIKEALQILHAARFILQRGQGAGSRWAKNGDNSIGQVAGQNGLGHGRCDVMHIGVSFCLQGDGVGLNGHQPIIAQVHMIPQQAGDASVALPAGKGSYALLLRLDGEARLQIGRLGLWDFAAGYYLYLGSALGSGGLAARLRRHLSTTKRPFWHIDYLRSQAVVEAIWYTEHPARLEHHWAAVAAQTAGATIPAPRFGASDCRCPAHLVYFRDEVNFGGTGCRSQLWGV